MNRFIALISAVLVCIQIDAREYHGKVTYNTYRGLVMAGYQGWHNTPGDGAGRGWHHYEGRDGFHPGSTNVDLWPDVSEYKKVYPSRFRFADGTVACLPSPADSSTVDTQFGWMEQYGLDGVFMQRFVAEIRNESGMKHFSHVLDNAMAAANAHGRAISIMYDLSGMRPDEVHILLDDIQVLAKRHHLFEHAKNPSYLYHNGKPLVAVWGVGFNDGRAYSLQNVQTIITALKEMGFSILIGVPTYWRELRTDTEADPRLHQLIRQCDIVMPWFVGRYDEKSFRSFHGLIKKDMEWAEKNHVDYAPLCFPGFSWKNMHWPAVPPVTIPRDKGRFFKMQLDYAVKAGARMIYVAMFDEIDEGTAIFKLARRVPVATPGSTFTPLEDGVKPELYMQLAGEASKKLKRHE